MSAPRQATIPFEHVEAELAAFPLVSEASFRLGIPTLEPLVSLKSNDKLWRAAEKHILNTLPSVPPDEAVAIRDKLWFDSSNPHQTITKPISLLKYLRRIARSYLDEQGRPIEVATPETYTRGRAAPEARLRWSWMCRALPPDLLRVARDVVDADGDPFPLNPTLQQVLRDRGFAETHLHLGASTDFSLAWAGLMRGLIRDERRHSDFESFGAYFNHGQDLGSWILYAAVVRLILAEWLFNSQSSNSSSEDLLQFTYNHRRLGVVERHRFATLLSEFRHGRWFTSARSDLAHEPNEHLAKRYARTRSLYHRLIGPPDIFRDRENERRTLRALYNPESRHDVYSNDPLARVVGWHPTEDVSPETLFVRAAFRYIEQNNKNSEFASLFWQVIRIRCLVYRHVVQRPLKPGLQWFVRFFARIKPLRQNISERVLTSTAARICGQDVGLRSLEVRLGTEEGVSDCLEKIRQVEKAMFPSSKDTGLRPPQFRLNKDKRNATNQGINGEEGLEVGVLFHFSRKRGGGWELGKLNAYGLDHSYPRTVRTRIGSQPLRNVGNPSGFRFARFYNEQRRHAQALVSVFQKYPLALRTVRGFDLCTDEAGVPVWVMAPLIRWVRDAGQQAAIHLKSRGEFKIPPPRISVHAGEDFVHLQTGLRRLDESVTYLHLEEGDRLGHALALGVDPSIWCVRAGRVILTRDERLFDLIWEWGCYARHGIGVASERLAYVRTEMVRLTRDIFGRSYAPEDLLDFVDRLHKEKELRAEGFPDNPTLRAHNLKSQEEREGKEGGEPDPDGRRLLRLYLGDERVWRRGRVPETIDLRNVGHERIALGQLQNGLRRKVGRLCLTIEVNPSSNLLIGDLGNFVGHPLWRLRPVGPEDDVAPLSVCIGSDDPLTFATTLPHEYQLLFDALILMGRSHDEAMRWIDEARNAGMQSRFTLTPDLEQISEGLKVPNLLGWERPDSPP
jgi:hypothetical protein